MVLERHVLRIACYVVLVQTKHVFLVEATQIPKESRLFPGSTGEKRSFRATYHLPPAVPLATHSTT